ncbi:S9 family peptidase [Pseudonocardia sp. N23]|uniref:S9 family peptidase n=1 Tax=Pseudonocardia sp. N23 TaxID=1987376 RepID=UPI000BFD34C8|nr:S9 family peptidase [Pseudonocardia sp. N23]GAY12193.1 acylamino-acid-releasing enzyme [Pseudonocardia sp. N23]
MTLADRRRERLVADNGPAADVLRAPSFRAPRPGPDGSLLAWISDLDGRPRLYVGELGAGAEPVVQPGGSVPTELDDPDLPPADVSAVAWSPDGSWLACQLAPGGGERTRVLLVSPDGSRRREIAPGAAAVVLGSWSPSGSHLGVTIYGEGRGDGQACLVDVRDGTSTVLASGPAAVVCAVSGDGHRVVVRSGRRGDRHLELIDLRTGRRSELVPGGATVADARFGVTGGLVYLHTDAGRDRAALLAVSLQAGAPAIATVVAERSHDDLDLVALDPAGARAVLVWNVDGRSEAEMLDLRSGMLSPLPDAAGDVVTDAAFTRDGGGLLLASEGPTVAPHVSLVPIVDGLPGTEAPAVLPPEPDDPDDDAADVLVTPTLHEFRADDGLTLTGWLFRPRGTFGPTPTLIWLHGGPEAQERPVFQPLFQALAASGIAVFAPNVRGSAGFGQAFSHADDVHLRFAAIADVRAAVDFLAGSGLADPARIGVSGRSYGGYLTLAALVRYPELFRVGVDVCGMADLETFYAATEPWIAEAATSKYGDPRTDAELLRRLSPIHRIDRLTAPLLVVHGRHDTNVPISEPEQVVAALRERGVPHAYLLFDDEGHEVHDLGNRAAFVREVVSWVGGHLTEVGTRTA